MKEIVLWKTVTNDDGKLKVERVENVSQTETEDQLEEVITGCPELLMNGLTLVGRQTETVVVDS